MVAKELDAFTWFRRIQKGKHARMAIDPAKIAGYLLSRR
jgi:hypothetical protein